MPVLDLEGVKHTLPHSEPILLVDTVESFTPETTIVATRHLPANDPVFAGHFPDHPIFPGVLGLEALAQTSGLLVNLTLNKTAAETLFYYMGIEKVKFKNPVNAGDTIKMTVMQERRLRDIYRFSGTLSKEENGSEITCTTATFTAKLINK